MAVLHLTLTEEGVAVLRDALTCLSKFSEEVTIEAKRDQFSLSTITLSKNAYANFSFSTARCFTRYRFEGNAQFREKFFCTLYTRTLIAILRPRSNVGTSTEKQSAYERCEISVQDGPDVKSRFMAKFLFRNGITTRHRIPFESKRPQHAKFSAAEAANTWAIPAGTLRELTEQHVGSGADLLDIHSGDDNVTFTYYTEGALVDNEALRTPLHTAIAVDIEEFDGLEVEDDVHIVMTTKDFRAIVHHASLAGSSIVARYSVPGRPLRFAYQADGVACEFIVMTAGDRGPGDKKTSQQKDRPAKKGGERGGGGGGGEAARTSSLRRSHAGGLEATSHRSSMAPPAALARPSEPVAQLSMMTRTTATAPGARSELTLTPRASASRFAGFDLRPTQMQMTPRTGIPVPTAPSEGGLFVDDDYLHHGDDDDRRWDSLDAQDAEKELLAEDDARLEWAYDVDASTARSGAFVSGPQREMSTSAAADLGEPESAAASVDVEGLVDVDADMAIEPTQRLSEVAGLGLFGRSKTR